MEVEFYSCDEGKWLPGTISAMSSEPSQLGEYDDPREL